VHANEVVRGVSGKNPGRPNTELPQAKTGHATVLVSGAWKVDKSRQKEKAAYKNQRAE